MMCMTLFGVRLLGLVLPDLNPGWSPEWGAKALPQGRRVRGDFLEEGHCSWGYEG